MRRWRQRWASSRVLWEQWCGVLNRRWGRRLNVRHLSDGTLRRVQDDDFAIGNRERAHLASCDRCRHSAERVAADAAYAARMFAAPVVDATATEAALGRFRRLAGSGAADRGDA